jgi:hypothetical protein
MGLPSTGKTSFLAALWYLVNQTHVDSGLALEKLDGDSTYLNQIREAWLEFKPVPRNPLDSETLVSMALKERSSGQAVRLTFPDLSGESFRLQWTKRQLTRGYDNCLQEASGAILFVHPSRVSKPHRIDLVEDLANEIGDAKAVNLPQEQPDVCAPKAWDPEEAPTQVQLVELLQFVAGREYFKAPFRLAVAVSAWDVLSKIEETPEQWVSSQLPLLRQYLECNSGSFDVAFYGVSAQGGEYADGQVAELQTKRPAERILVEGNSIKNQHDLTEPLQWLMR